MAGDEEQSPGQRQEAAVNEIKHTQQGGGLFRENKFKSHETKCEHHNAWNPRVIMGWICPVQGLSVRFGG
jgi:hypothetical protein